MEVSNKSLNSGKVGMSIRAADAAYLAGLIDGEGTFGVYKGRTKKCGFRAGFYIGSVDKILISRIQKILRSLGVQLHVSTRKGGFLFLQTEKLSNLEKIIRATLPHLCLKKPQAGVILGFVRTKGVFASGMSYLTRALNQRSITLSEPAEPTPDVQRL